MPTHYETFLSSIKATMGEISNIGKVHDYQRLFLDLPAMFAQFKTTVGGVEQIRGWCITREATKAKTQQAKKGIMRSYEFVIRGYMAIDDSTATEKEFQVLVENILDTFDATPDLFGTAWDLAPAELEILETHRFGSVLCHFARIRLRVYKPVNM